MVSIEISKILIILYICNLTLSAIVIDFSKESSKYSLKALSYIIFLNITFIIVLVSSLRYGIGTDFYSYMDLFNEGESDDILFKLLIFTCKNIYNNFISLIFLSSLITHSIINNIFFKKSKYYTLSLFLYLSMWYYFGSWNLIRQYISIALCMQSAIFIFEDKKIILGLFLSFIAALIHSSSTIFIVIMLLIYFFKKYAFYFIITFLLAIYLFYDKIIQNMQIYFNFKYFHYLYMKQNLNYTAFIISIASIIPLILYINKAKMLQNKTIIYIEMYIIGCLFMLLSNKNLFFTRVAFYFLIFQTIFIPNIVFNIKDILIKYILILYYIGYGVINIIISFNQCRDGVIPLMFRI